MINHFNFENLPLELQISVCQQMDVRTLCRLAQTSSAMRNLASDDQIWQVKLAFYLQQQMDQSGFTGYKSLYRNVSKINPVLRNLILRKNIDLADALWIDNFFSQYKTVDVRVEYVLSQGLVIPHSNKVLISVAEARALFSCGSLKTILEDFYAIIALIESALKVEDILQYTGGMVNTRLFFKISTLKEQYQNAK